MGITRVVDVLEHYPRRYIDRTARALISDVALGEEVTVFAEVARINSRRTRRGRALVEAVVTDGTSDLTVVFFNQAWRARQLPQGTEAAFFGKVDEYRGRRQMTNPAVDVLGNLGERTGTIVPVYPQSGKAEVSSALLYKLVGEVLRRAQPRGFSDPLSSGLRERLGLVDRDRAYEGIHRPETVGDHRGAARRLVFDEFLRMQVGLVARKRALAADQCGIAHDVGGALESEFVRSLPFDLTDGQDRALEQIASDMAAHAPMHRLLQGDVGSGKTVVAVAAALRAIEGDRRRRSWRPPRCSPSSTICRSGRCWPACRCRPRAR
ncbi:MAG: OB-fold nucleic acid binding domain-containing protein [Acidimicrobiia bacterium]|nr:OB-fold nucleic acid binding domain-containing protein [Acidimicrobiia bacterium]